jgi:hypothetical protein
VTGGRADFVLSGEDLSAKVIQQLQCSLSASLAQVEIHLPDDSLVEVSPFPILPVAQAVSSTIFVKSSASVDSVLVSADCCGERQDIAIEVRPSQIDGALFYGLYTYEALKCLERDMNRPGSTRSELAAKCVNLSMSSGVLCNETAFVGVSEKVYRPQAQPPTPTLGGYSQFCCDVSPRQRVLYGIGQSPSPCDGGAMYFEPAPRARPCACAAPVYSREPEGSGMFSWLTRLFRRSSDDSPRAPPPQRAATPGEERAPPTPAAAPGDDLMRIIGMQQLDGSWADVARLLEVAGTQILLFSELAGLDKKQRERAFATILAVALLRKRCSWRQSSWAMIERKALEWLGRIGVDVDLLIGRAVALL